jgi:methionine biosynthesis protein MetW
MTVIAKTYGLEDARGYAAAAASARVRWDLRVIIDLVPAGTKVLDLGCGDGTLLSEMLELKTVFARGVEVQENNVRTCIARGLSVRHGDIEHGLADFQDRAFDFVILSQTIGYLNRPLSVLSEMLRVGRFAVISMENAGYWRRRVRAAVGQGAGSPIASGQPVTRSITLGQFEQALNQLGLKAARTRFVGALGWVWPSLLADTAVYLVTKEEFKK